MTAAVEATRRGLRTLITLESDTDESNCLKDFLAHRSFIELSKNRYFTYQVNSWMPFHEGALERKISK